eukprot:8794027-Pyramimonas_sp.AAC.1
MQPPAPRWVGSVSNSVRLQTTADLFTRIVGQFRRIRAIAIGDSKSVQPLYTRNRLRHVLSRDRKPHPASTYFVLIVTVDNLSTTCLRCPYYLAPRRWAALRPAPPLAPPAPTAPFLLSTKHGRGPSSLSSIRCPASSSALTNSFSCKLMACAATPRAPQHRTAAHSQHTVSTQSAHSQHT